MDEIVSMNNCHIQVKDGLTVAFLPKSKTEPRKVPITENLPHLLEWIRKHPYSDMKNKEAMAGGKDAEIYGHNLFEEVARFSEAVKILAKTEDFDVVHAHDWMTYMAGVEVKKHLNKPLVVHMHATEFDRSGGINVNDYICSIEKEGLEYADFVIANSNYTKQFN